MSIRLLHIILSTGSGFTWLARLGHTVQEPTPTIAPLLAKNAWIKSLAGKTLTEAKMAVYVEDEKKFTVTGDILMVRFGLSGLTILNSAGKVADPLHAGRIRVAIDLFPDLDIEALDKKLQEHFGPNKNKLLRNVSSEFLPPGK